MNTSTIVGLVIAASAVVVGVCAFSMTRSTDADVKEPEVDYSADDAHVEYVNTAWANARNEAKDDILGASAIYVSIHSEMHRYIEAAEFVNEELRETLHGINAMNLSETI